MGWRNYNDDTYDYRNTETLIAAMFILLIIDYKS